MNADHHFEIGKDHRVCQDYAFSACGENHAVAVVCDGCSSSSDVDFGARALALSVKRTLMIGGGDMNWDLFGKVTINNLSTIGDKIPLDPRSLDATLLLAFVKGKEFKAHIFGDGVFFHKTATTLRIVHVDFESNKPDYLSYHLDKLRMKEYDETVTGSKHVLDTSYYLANEGKESIEIENYIKPFEPVTFNGLVENGDILGVMSDGVNSFRLNNGDEIRGSDIVKEFVDFKSTVGVFVARRILALKRQYTKEQITHSDDISVSAIAI